MFNISFQNRIWFLIKKSLKTMQCQVQTKTTTFTSKPKYIQRPKYIYVTELEAVSAQKGSQMIKVQVPTLTKETHHHWPPTFNFSAIQLLYHVRDDVKDA